MGMETTDLTIRENGPGALLASMKSLTKQDQDYYISWIKDNDHWNCTCPDYQYRKKQEGKDCKHIARAKSYLDDLFRDETLKFIRSMQGTDYQAGEPWAQKFMHLWPEEEKSCIAQAIMQTAIALDTFNADDVRERSIVIGESNPATVSAMYSALVHMEWIEFTGQYIKSRHKENHHRLLRIWRLNRN